MVNFPTCIPCCGSHSPAHLDLFFDASIYSTMAFLPLGNFDVVSFSIDFPSNSKEHSPFHCIAYNYSHTDWDRLCGHFRNVPLEDIFKLSASAPAIEFCEWVQVGLISLIVNTSSSFTHLYSFRLLVMLLQLIEITFLVFTNRINLMNLE